METVFQTLVEKRTRQTEQLQKVQQALRHFEQERQKLDALEAELATLARHYMDSAATASAQSPPDDDKGSRICIVVNPGSKGMTDDANGVDAIVAELRTVGIMAEVCMTTPENGAHAIAREAAQRHDPLLIVVGGDGTIEEVAAELVGSRTTLGLIPSGTMNNVARALGVPLDIHAACLLLGMGATRQIDIGRVVTPDHSLDGYFLETAGLGLSALAAPMGEAMEKGRWNELFGKLGEFLAFNATHVSIVTDDGDELHANTEVVTLSNAPLFGNNMLIAPDAKMDDGLLDLAVYEGMDKLALGRYFLNTSAGGRANEPRVHFRRVRAVRITTDTPLAANADLDVLTQQQTWEIEVIPDALTVIVGNGPALTFPVVSAPVAPPLAGPQPPVQENPK